MKDSPYVATTNACKLCTPLGAALVYRGIEGAVPFLHGSQGCATYMRRYVISHFREPVDVASSALGEKHAVFGGGPNLKKGLINVMRKYDPKLIGVATTCLTETIGDDVPMILSEFFEEFSHLNPPAIVHASTPSYSGSHMDGWHAAVRAVVDQMVVKDHEDNGTVNILPGFCSPADVRHLKEIAKDFGLEPTILPDISLTLDGPALEDYEPIPRGGTPLDAIRSMSGARATIELGSTRPADSGAAALLDERFEVPGSRTGLPIGIRASDSLFNSLSQASGRPVPTKHELSRGRLVDAYVDGHKYVFGQRAVVYGEEDLVAAMVGFLAETGIRPVLAATGGRAPGFKKSINDLCQGLCEAPEIREGVDFQDISEEAEALSPDLMIGHSKGYRYAKKWNIPLVRVGFPIHDRFGAQRVRTYGFEGTLALYDRLVNAVLSRKQSENPVGYGYL